MFNKKTKTKILILVVLLAIATFILIVFVLPNTSNDKGTTETLGSFESAVSNKLGR